MSTLRFTFIVFVLLTVPLLLLHLLDRTSSTKSVSYVYSEVDKLDLYIHLYEGELGNWLSFTDLVQSEEVDSIDATVFLSFSGGENSWLKFAYPVERQAGERSWNFNSCNFEILEESEVAIDAPDGSIDREPIYMIQKDCGIEHSIVRFIYAEERGLLSFTLGSIDKGEGRNRFDVQWAYVLTSGPYGFGSLR